MCRDLTGKMLKSKIFSTETIGNLVRKTGTALLDTSVLSICGPIMANMRLLQDAGNKQFAQEMALTGCSMKEVSNGSVMRTKEMELKAWTPHMD